MSDSSSPSKKRVIRVGSDRSERSRTGRNDRDFKARGGTSYGRRSQGHRSRRDDSQADGSHDGRSRGGRRSRTGSSHGGNPRGGNPRSGSFRGRRPGASQRRDSDRGRARRDHRGGGSRSQATTPKPLTKARIELRNFLVLEAVIRRQEDLGYYQYFLDLPGDRSLRLSSLSPEHTRFYSKLSPFEKKKPLTLLVYPRIQDNGQVNSVALGGIYAGRTNEPETHLPEELQPNQGYLTARFVGSVAPEPLQPESDSNEPEQPSMSYAELEQAAQSAQQRAALGKFKIASKSDPTRMEFPALDIASVAAGLKPEDWVDLRYRLEPVGEQFKLVVTDVVSQESLGKVVGWNDPFYEPPRTEEDEVDEAEEEVRPRRRSWYRVERPVKKGRYKYQVR